MSPGDGTTEQVNQNADQDDPLPLFSSPRERRLWAWTLIVVVAIYSTLGLAAALAGTLRDRGMLDSVFVLGFVLVLLNIVTQGLKTRPRGIEVGIGLGVAAAYLMVIVRMAIPAAERTHLIEYGVVALFIHAALLERASQGRRVPLPALLAIIATSLVGVLDECIQAILPSRVFEAQDILFNVLAGLMAVLASVILDWARRRFA